MTENEMKVQTMTGAIHLGRADRNFYDRKHEITVPVCSGQGNLHGAWQVADETPLTCKRCIATAAKASR